MNDDDADEMLKQMRERFGKEAAENPFIASKEFLEVVKRFAAFPNLLLMSSGSPAEAMNAIESLLVTFLKNIPDPVWEIFRKMATHPNNAKQPSAERFPHWDHLRNFEGKSFEWDSGGANIPPFNVRPSTRPQ